MFTSQYKERISILGVPMDVVKPENLSLLIEEMLESGDSHQVMFLKFSDLFRARRKGEYQQAVQKASLVLPLSKRLIRAAKFIKESTPEFYKPFDLIIRIFGVVEKKRGSSYLLGSKLKRMQKSHRNLRDSFPGVTFVGRHSGFYDKTMEDNILMAIKKASPSFLLTGRGIKGKELWLHRNRQKINPSIMLWDRHCYEVFAGSRQKPSHSSFSQFMVGFLKLIIMPWRLFLIFRYFWYLILLLQGKSRKKKEAGS